MTEDVTVTTRNHNLVKMKFSKAVVCKICNKWIRGLGNNSGFICLICAIPVHKSCGPKANKTICREAVIAIQFEPFVPVVRENCLQNFQRLLYQAQEYNFDFPKKIKPAVDDIMKAKIEDFGSDLAAKINTVWQTKTIHSLYEEYWEKWQIAENADYFFDHVVRISSTGFLPNSQDMLRAKQKSKSYKDKTFKVWLPKGAKLEFDYNPDETLGDILNKVKHQKLLSEETPYLPWDSKGVILVGSDQITLSQMESLEIYYYPEGSKPTLLNASQNTKKTRRLSGGNHSPSAVRNERISRNIFSSKPYHSKANILVSNTVAHEKRSGTLSVTIHDAQNLAINTETFQTIYLIISDASGEKRYRSLPIPVPPPIPVMVPGGPVPVYPKLSWEQTFKFPVATDYSEFVVKAWATNNTKGIPDVLIGQAGIVIEKYGDGETKPDETIKMKKELKKFKANRKANGSLRISWQYLDKKLKVVEKKVETVEGEVDKELKEEPKKTLEEVYDIGDKLGEGAFSVVKAGTHKENGTKVAVKILDNYSNIENAEEDVVRFQQETSIIKSLDHKNIVKMYDIFEDHEHYYVVMELVSGGELFDQIVEKGFFPEEEACQLIKQILSALTYLEQHKICHRDLKPENLIFTDETHTTLKLIDFGEAKSYADGLIREYVGTTDYMAPEIIKGGEYDNRVDLWSLGVIAFVMLCGFPPWEGENESEVFVNIMTLRYEFPSPEWDAVSEDAKDFIRQLLVEMDDRLTAKEARLHPWVHTKSEGNCKMTLEVDESVDCTELIQILKKQVETLGLQGGDVEITKGKNNKKILEVSFEELT
eukprot:TRINITY_DN14360_c1_g3_i1.p1 TRINITY_DN14360_c1_g3~~TRINITY_DN14360_c1_g3_i1.p1  ORF type:complete len:820 (-),score=174.67 TRINITY_DN14360_c1_g3_i1:129-2588(-)